MVKRTDPKTDDSGIDWDMTGQEAFERAMRIKLDRNRAWRASVASAQQSDSGGSTPSSLEPLTNLTPQRAFALAMKLKIDKLSKDES